MRLPVLLLAVSLSCLAEDDIPRIESGVDVLKAGQAVIEALRPEREVAGKPWAGDLAALSNPTRDIAQRGIRSLVQRGQVVLPDLEVLAHDIDPLVRTRVAEVVMGIGGTAATPLAILQSQDEEPRVRELAALGLGRCQGDAVRPRLEAMLDEKRSEVRTAAAAALGLTGEVAALGPLLRADTEPDSLAQRAMTDSVARLVARPEAVPVVIDLLARESGGRRDVLLTALLTVTDPRLCPALLTLVRPAQGIPEAPPGGRLKGQPQAWTTWLALRALATNGDSRAWEALCQIAADAPNTELRETAAATMRALSGWQTGAGKTWQVWWSDHATEAAARIPLDTFLASLRDPTAPVSRAELAAFSQAQLMPLVDAALGRTGWWAARALQALRADDPARWSQPLLARYTTSTLALERIGLVLIVATLSGPAAADTLTAMRAHLEALASRELAQADDQGRVPPDHGAERAAFPTLTQHAHAKP